MAARVVLCVIDGLGVGELPDAARYGDQGSNTLLNAARAGTLRAPHLDRLGLGAVQPAPGLGSEPVGAHGKMAERSAGKDSMTGHRELAGVITPEPLETFPAGFPSSLIGAFQEAVGRPVLGNVVMPGTDVVRLYGEEALRTGSPVVYTSADSVFQVAAHTDPVPADTLYDWCLRAREIVGPRVGRVIARPFTGPPGAFERIGPGRRDYPIPLPQGSLLQLLREAGMEVAGVGKVPDLFGAELFTRTAGSGSDAEALWAALELLPQMESGLLFANFGEVDSSYGHRNDPDGWCHALHRLDSGLSNLLNALEPRDVLIVTGDHGNDPVTPSTDHSREYVPVLAVTGRGWRAGGPSADLGTRETFADVGATVAELLIGRPSGPGTSFARDIP